VLLYVCEKNGLREFVRDSLELRILDFRTLCHNTSYALREFVRDSLELRILDSRTLYHNISYELRENAQDSTRDPTRLADFQ
jgi:hypothetical protein